MSDALKLSSFTPRIRDESRVGQLPTVGEKSVPCKVVPPELRAVALPIGRSVQLQSEDSSTLSKLIGRLRFRQLALLVALDDHRNLHRAANAVHLAQPTASKSVHDLESLFRSPLFDRMPTGMHPTEFGSVVCAFARRTVGELKRVATASDNRYCRSDKPLIIGITADLPMDRVAEAMAEIRRIWPRLAMKVICDSNDRLVDQMVEGEMELAVGYPTHCVRQEMIDYQLSGREAFCIVARQDHPLAREPSIDVYDLHRAAWILPSQNSFARHLIDRLLQRAEASSPANVLELNSVDMAIQMLLRSDLVGLLPECVATRHLLDGRLARLPIAVDNLFVEFGILTRRGEPLSPAALQLCQMLRRPNEAGIA
jgi:DNA-binding transcriptional LysR family regulator